MMEKKIQEIADITIGHTIEKSIDKYTSGDAYILRTTDLVGGIYLSDINKLKKVNVKKLQPTAVLQSGDIVLAARSTQGVRIQSNIFKKRIEKNVKIVATSSLFVIRVYDTNFLPEYIVLYLNSNEGQKQLKRIVTQGTIQSISVKDFRKLKIPHRPLGEQKKMVDLAIIIDKQKELLQRKIALQNIIIKNIINLIK